ncbi:hypothetical protein MPTK1_3g00340 [Marchantia polymorpha subsp. ruderalis]|uniref:Metallothionein-like protein n=2 Tax=Marchantia polymorpha TaxID=3197 RepID=A0AAF6AVV3_MARPO|nr:hypothetical protein MARPO_0007s0031 [Marchantia polymorpha]BBN03887.1 hypothetical protein Mp_3g00340 [Marchantia polymorpha subsp. ruderalis]|eukprot:PTQ47576.1 hypothetical protein MARPO_0007s0031 [Marchantia polymorpha]
MSGCGNSVCSCGSNCQCGSNCSCGKRMMDVKDILNMQSFEHGSDGISYNSRCL